MVRKSGVADGHSYKKWGSGGELLRLAGKWVVVSGEGRRHCEQLAGKPTWHLPLAGKNEWRVSVWMTAQYEN